LKANNTRNIKLKGYRNISDFKIGLIQKLKLYNPKRDSEIEFYKMLEGYLERNRGTEFEMVISKSELYKKLYSTILGELTKQEIPKNYPRNASNMETQAFYTPISEERRKLSEEQAKNKADKDMEIFLNELNKINGFENFNIVVQE